MKELENLKEMYLDEIKKITKKGELTPTDSEAAHEALKAIELIDKICDEWDEMEESGHSERMYPRHSMRRMMPEMPTYEYGYDHNRSYNDGYRDGYADRRGRSSTTGRYISRHNDPSARNRMIGELETLYSEAPDERTKMVIRRAIDNLDDY